MKGEIVQGTASLNFKTNCERGMKRYSLKGSQNKQTLIIATSLNDSTYAMDYNFREAKKSYGRSQCEGDVIFPIQVLSFRKSIKEGDDRFHKWERSHASMSAQLAFDSKSIPCFKIRHWRWKLH